MKGFSRIDSHIHAPAGRRLCQFYGEGLMNDMGSFLQSKFGKRKGDWVQLPEVNEVFDQVIEVLKHDLESKPA